MKQEREHHFVGLPSTYAVDTLMQNTTGFQTRDAIVAFYPNEKIYYSVDINENADRLKITFQSRETPNPYAACELFNRERLPYISYNPPFNPPFEIETEVGELKKIIKQ